MLPQYSLRQFWYSSLLCLLSCTYVAGQQFSNGTSYVVSFASGQPAILDPTNGDSIVQGKASDGSGYGYDAPAIIWIIVTLAIGVPALLAGVRIGRVSSGIGLGLAIAVTRKFRPSSSLHSRKSAVANSTILRPYVAQSGLLS